MNCRSFIVFHSFAYEVGDLLFIDFLLHGSAIMLLHNGGIYLFRRQLVFEMKMLLSSLWKDRARSI